MRGKLTDKRVRAKAVGLAMVVGANEASRQMGIPERSVRRWVMDPEMAELAARTKDEVAAEWWAIVQKGFRRVEALLDSTDDAQKAATATAIIYDKMALSRGDPTVRSETRSLDGFDDHEKRALRDAIDARLNAEGETARDSGDAAVEAASSA